jgi:regulator of protease activity HflC (stomatin/prohibitin superfamily)
MSTDRRGQTATASGLAIQLVGLITLLVLGFLSGSRSVLAGGLYMLGGVAIWFTLLLVYTQRKRAARKDQEVEELKRARAADPSLAIFELEEGTVERRRLEWMYRWLLLIATLVLAAYHLVVPLLFDWGWSLGTALDSDVWTKVASPGPVMAVTAGVGFVCFLFSRYASGMARESDWRLLRAGSSYLAGNALACLAIVVALGLQSYDVTYGEPIIAHAIRILMVVLGIEFVVALILNYYRPRVPGEIPRPAFDSRLLEMISEPGGVARSIAEAINYQFGFEVTKTWFGQLIKRAFFPLCVLGFLVLLLLSSVVIVDANEEAYVEHFGRLKQKPGEAWGPGLHLKWPWPVDRVYRAPVRKLQSAMVGDAPVESPYDEKTGALKAVLWGKKHGFTSEMMTIVASPPGTEYDRVRDSDQEEGKTAGGGKAVAVSLLNISVPIEFRIKDLHQYLYGYEDANRVLEMIAFRAFSDYAAGVDVDRLMGPGRVEFAERFRAEIQHEIDNLDPPLGIEITYLALQSAHPTDEEKVAETFQQVITAQIEKDTALETARGEAKQMLSLAAGDAERAEALVAAVSERDRLDVSEGAGEAARNDADRRVNDLLLGNRAKDIPRMSGRGATLIARAEAEWTRLVSSAESKSRLFEAEVVAYEAAPDLYMMRKYLEMLEKSLNHVRKYVVTFDTERKNLNIIVQPEKQNVIDLMQEPQ